MAQHGLAIAVAVAAACILLFKRHYYGGGSVAERTQMGACGRKSYLGVVRAGENQLIKWHWGDHTDWVPTEATLPEEPVIVSPDTPLYGICRDGESDGAVWVKDDWLHFVWQDSYAWGTYKYSYDRVPLEMEGNPPLAASGRPGFRGIWWAGDNKIYMMHSGGYNDWAQDVVELQNDVPIKRGDKLYAWSRGSEADGIVWPGDGVLNILYHDDTDWDTWHHTVVDATVQPSTLLASCGRTGWYGIWWAAPSGDKINVMHAGAHTDWELTPGELEPTVSVSTHTPLSAICVNGQYDGVAWQYGGDMHHLYESSPDFGTWTYESYAMKADD